MRTLDPAAHRLPETQFDPGPAPMLQWVSIKDLVVDEAYQRPIRGAGAKNVSAIAERFAWSKFAPLIVSPVEGGRFAVIDGQHRATAATLRGVEQLPALVVIADRAAQAAAFKAVNGQTTRMNTLQLHKAAVAAGEPDAVLIDEVCRLASVKILNSNSASSRMRPGETIGIVIIQKSVARHGADRVAHALQCVTRTSNNIPGGLTSTIIEALVAIVTDPQFRGVDYQRLYDAFDQIKLLREEDKAKFTPREKGVALWEILRDRLRSRLQEQLQAAPQSAAA